MLVLQSIGKSFCQSPVALARIQRELWERAVLTAGGRAEEAQCNVLHKAQVGLASSAVAPGANCPNGPRASPWEIQAAHVPRGLGEVGRRKEG